MLRRVQLAYGACSAALIVAYYAWSTARPVTTGLVALVSVASILVAVVRMRPRRWGGWLLIAGSVALLGIGDVVFATLADDTPGPVAYPGPPDVFYLLAYLPLALGLFFLGRPKLPSRDWPMLLDTIGLSLAGSLVVWIVLARPAVLSLHLTGPGKVTAIASWAGYVAVLATAARVMLVWRTNLALGLLTCGVLTFLVADFFYGRQMINGTWSTGSLIDLGFLAFSLFAGAAALTRSMRLVASPGYARHDLGPVRLAVVAVVLLVAPCALLVQATAGPVTTGVAIALVTGAVGLLMLVRLSLSARAYRMRAANDQAVATAAGALVRATTPDDVLAALRNALRALVSRRGTPSDAQPSTVTGHAQDSLMPNDRNSLGDLRVPLDSPVDASTSDGQGTGQWHAITYTAPMVELVELAPVLRTMTHQASLAFERIGLLADLRAEERERYFRSLVLTSEDVTLISRQGHISYATPSARAMFGRDIVGQRFESVLPSARRHHSQPYLAGLGMPFETALRRPDGSSVTVRVRQRDLTQDPSVAGVVATLRDVTAERQLQHDLAYRASHDQLTGLANAEQFTHELEKDGQGPDRGSHVATKRAALFIDLDDFKMVNDTYGHAIGDQLLTEVARRIRSCLRTGDVAARFGGDEFAVMLRNVTDVDAARGVAQRISDALGRPAFVEGTPLDCQASIGLAYSERGGDLDMLIREADTALYAAKAKGKGHWREYREGMRTPTRHNIDNRRRLQAAIETHDLVLYYQPIVAMETGEAAGFEALIRFPGAVPPMQPQEIIAIAEETGLIIKLGEWIISQALADLIRLNADPARRRYISVNLSARQLRQPDFVDKLRRELTRTETDPTLLVLEVTESLLVDSDDRAWAGLDELRRDGIRVAIDDYGTGYASLSYLRQPPIDVVKIDKSFVRDLTAERSRALLRAVVNLSHELGLETIAEGVERSDSEAYLQTIGCRFGQGFRYAAAMPVSEAVTWVYRPQS